MASVTLSGVRKVFPNGFEAIRGIDLEIADGEFVVLVGPSGCGKSTLLRLIAGLEEVTDGAILIGARDVTDVPPAHRDIAMVFQSYALYPHMDVKDNLAFGLHRRRTRREAIRDKVGGIGRVLGLRELMDRRPGMLSGGQRQRVAIGRAMVREPVAYLMDEPLSNLDAKLRVSMRAELARLHHRLGVTTIYVTHDQTEAMTLGDRVCVLLDGVVQQVDAPGRLYRSPANAFVASFIGSPQMNLAVATVEGADLRLGDQSLELSAEQRARVASRDRVVVGFRPADFGHRAIDVSPHDDGAAPRAVRLTVDAEIVENLGSEQLVVFPMDVPRYVVGPGVVDTDDETLLAETARTRFTARLDMRREVRQGGTVDIWFDLDRLYLFDPDDGDTLESPYDAGAVPDSIAAAEETGTSRPEGPVPVAQAG
jgi:multiple sugar transport system ATP-binding protein